MNDQQIEQVSMGDTWKPGSWQQKEFARRDLRSINDVVTQQTYLVGDEMTVFDFCAASLLAGILDNKPATWLTDIARNEYPGLIDYADRIQAEVGVYGRQ